LTAVFQRLGSKSNEKIRQPTPIAGISSRVKQFHPGFSSNIDQGIQKGWPGKRIRARRALRQIHSRP